MFTNNNVVIMCPRHGTTLSNSLCEAELLQERLEKPTFEEMQNPKSPLFSNELCNLIKSAKKLSATCLQNKRTKQFECIN